MEISQDSQAKRILSSLPHPIYSNIIQAIEAVHPSKRMGQIEVSPGSHLLAIGKNALTQARSLLMFHPGKFDSVIIHQIKGYTDEMIDHDNTTIHYLSHPLPDDTTFERTSETLEFLKSLDEATELHILISGGGSAALALPEEQISSKNYLEILRLAIASGFSIEEINLIRSLIDRVKGGKLAADLPHLNIKSWITSDVIMDDPKVVASGPTASGIEITPSVRNWLDRLIQNLHVDVRLDVLISKLVKTEADNAVNTILTNRMDLISKLQDQLIETPYESVIVDASLTGSIDDAKSQISQSIDQFSDFTNRVLIWTGEPTIALTSNAIKDGQGGRISSLACLMASDLAKYDHIVFLGLATDGVDGSSPASGYVIDSETASKLGEFGDTIKLIKSGNSGLALSSLELGLHLENTDINLLDLYLVIIS